MIGEALRLIRVYHDLKQSDLADQLGISQSHLSEIERGKKAPTSELIERYSKEFRLPVSSIWFSMSIWLRELSRRHLIGLVESLLIKF